MFFFKKKTLSTKNWRNSVTLCDNVIIKKKHFSKKDWRNSAVVDDSQVAKLYVVWLG
jgi:hypothetical protein